MEDSGYASRNEECSCDVDVKDTSKCGDVVGACVAFAGYSCAGDQATDRVTEPINRGGQCVFNNGFILNIYIKEKCLGVVGLCAELDIGFGLSVDMADGC